MAAITYKISGRSDNTAIDQTKGSIKSLGDVANSVKGIIAGFAALKSFQFLGKQVAETTKAFQIQQTALNTLSQSIRNNSNLTTGAMQRLVQFTTQLQSKSIYGDEELQKQATYLSNLGLTEDKIKDVLSASIDVASSGIMPLESAVKNMAKTYNGLGGELAKQIPEIRNLTEEQLRAGDAVKIMQRNFSGMAANATKTLEGQTAQFNNIVGDIKEKIGSVFGVFKQLALQKALPFIEDLDRWLEQSVPKIINFFLNLPEIAKMVFTSIATMIGKTFTLDFWIAYGKGIGTSLDRILGLALTTIVDNIKAVASIIFQPLDYAWKLFVFEMGTDFAKSVNKVIEGLEKVLNLIRGNTEELRVQELRAQIAERWDRRGSTYTRAQLEAEVQKELDKKGGTIGALSLGRVDESGAAPVNNVGGNIGQIFANNLTKLNQNIANIGKEVNNFGGILGDAYGDELSELGKALETILGRELPDNIKVMLQPAVKAIEDVTETINTYGYSMADRSGSTAFRPPTMLDEVASGSVDLFADKLDGLGGNVAILGDILKDIFVEGDYVAATLKVVGLVIDGLLETIGPPIMALADSIIKIISDVGRVLGLFLEPIISVLIPIVDLLGIMLMTALVPLLHLLSPSLEMIVSLIQVVVIPIIKMLAIAFEILMSPVKYIGDLFKWAADNIKIATNNMMQILKSPIDNIAALFKWGAEQVRIAINNLVEFIKNPFDEKKRNILNHTAFQGAGALNLTPHTTFSSDAFSGLGQRIADIWKMETTNTSVIGTNSNYSGGSASFTGKRDITVNMNFNNSYVNGDSQQIAIALHNEINNAQKLGLI